MLRLVAALVFLCGSVAPVSAAVLVGGAGEYVVSDAPEQDNSAAIKLEANGELGVSAAFGTALGSLALVSEDRAVVGGFSGAAVPTAFAGTVELMAGSKYLLSTTSSGISTLAFSISEVPLPGAIVLLGSAIAGLGLMRRGHAAA